MGNNKKPRSRRHRGNRHISVRTVQRDTPDLRKLGRALIAFAAAQAEAEAQQQTTEETAPAENREAADD